ncbi:hypothetical protein D3C78_1106980 [compost metagenome]
MHGRGDRLDHVDLARLEAVVVQVPVRRLVVQHRVLLGEALAVRVPQAGLAVRRGEHPALAGQLVFRVPAGARVEGVEVVLQLVGGPHRIHPCATGEPAHAAHRRDVGPHVVDLLRVVHLRVGTEALHVRGRLEVQQLATALAAIALDGVAVQASLHGVAAELGHRIGVDAFLAVDQQLGEFRHLGHIAHQLPEVPVPHQLLGGLRVLHVDVREGCAGAPVVHPAGFLVDRRLALVGLRGLDPARVEGNFLGLGQRQLPAAVADAPFHLLGEQAGDAVAFEGVVLHLVDVGGGNHGAGRQLGGVGGHAAGGDEAGGQGMAQGEAGYCHGEVSGAAQKR